MSISRPFSQASSSRSSNKPAFQTKNKPRIRGLSNFQDNFNISTDLQRQPNTVHIKDSHGFYSSRSETVIPDKKQQNQSKLNQTAMKLTDANFKNHCTDDCVCNECSCGRHLCKLNNIKPDLTKNTIYQKDFFKKAAPPAKIVYSKQYKQLEGPHLQMNSTQRVSFTDRQADEIQRPKPEDLLKNKGPVQALTTYKSLFPGHKGLNQYIKPTDRHTRQKFPLRSKSNYTQSFMNKNIKKDDYEYFNDQLKTGGNWYGKTSYGKFYQNPNPEYHAKKVKIVQKYELNPKFTHQYETVYKNDFIPKESTICGSKIMLQTRKRGIFSGSKSTFAQNSDFKAMSPQYQAFSTSGFSYV